MKISIQGEIGSYSHMAALNLYGNDIELLCRQSFKEVFEDLKEDRANAICIPIENSTYGSIYQNFDFLTKYNFHINSEVYLKVNFHLIVHPGTKLEEITELYTHPVAMGQIRGFLENHPSIRPIEFPDTSGSVKMIKEKGLKHAAAAASKAAAETYGMQVIKENIQDNLKNYTRFFGISKNGPVSKLPKNKTTIEFELGDEVGSLSKVLDFFAKKNIALTKIESRPIINTDWEYIFYLDFLASEEEIKTHIADLKYSVRHFRILGSYTKGEYINT